MKKKTKKKLKKSKRKNGINGWLTHDQVDEIRKENMLHPKERGYCPKQNP